MQKAAAGRSVPCSSSRIRAMAEHVASSAPDVTALYDTSIKKKCTKGIGGRTCRNSQACCFGPEGS